MQLFGLERQDVCQDRLAQQSVLEAVIRAVHNKNRCLEQSPGNGPEFDVGHHGRQHRVTHSAARYRHCSQHLALLVAKAFDPAGEESNERGRERRSAIASGYQEFVSEVRVAACALEQFFDHRRIERMAQHNFGLRSDLGAGQTNQIQAVDCWQTPLLGQPHS